MNFNRSGLPFLIRAVRNTPLQIVSHLFRRGLRRKIVCLALILSLLILPMPSQAFAEFSSFASSAVNLYWLPMRYAAPFINWMFGAKSVQRRAPKESQAQRANAVSRLQISPSRFVGYQGQTQKFNALPMNYDNQVIQGVKLSWESSDPDKLHIDDSGKAIFLHPGRVNITCRVGSVTASVAVQIRPGNRPVQSDEEWRREQLAVNTSGASSSDTLSGGTSPSGASSGDTLSSDTSSSNASSDDTSSATGSLLSRLWNQLMPTAEAQNGGPSDLGYDELYSDAKNLVGSPNHRIREATRTGAVLPEGSNAEFAVPLVGLGGRGIGASLMLFYNSRVWSRRNNAMAFDAINGEPSPGFSLGFGRIVAYQNGANYKLIWAEPDGTRHYLGQGSYYSTTTYQTSDGSDIKFIGNVANGGTITYPNGASVLVQVVNNRLLPTQILDTNGNYIQIAYKDSSSGFAPLSIDYVTDTLGRVIQLNYDGSYRLISIDAPGLGGTSQAPVTTTVVKFDYQTVNVTTNFSGLTIEKSPNLSTNSFLKHVYFPATNGGYLFTFSGYGMMYNISMRRAMSLNWQGVIQDGVESASEAFNYPTSGSTSLTDAPAFTQRTEAAVNATTATYTYYRNYYTDSVWVIIAQPNGKLFFQVRYTDTASVGKGLIYYTAMYEGDWATVRASTWIGYITDGGGKVRVGSVTGYDDTNTPTQVGFDYDSYGNVTNKREYGYPINSAWIIRRRTHFTYNTSMNIRGLVTLTQVYDALQSQSANNDGDDVLIAKASATYDDYAAMGGMESYAGQPTAPGHLAGYDATVTARGNVTGTTAWSDLANNLSTTRLVKYDIYGNVLKEQVSCCNVKSFVIPESNGYAMAEEVVSGDENGVHLSEGMVVDYNTGLLTAKTDARNKEVTYEYDAALRMRQVNLFTGAVASAAFADGSLSATSTVQYVENDVTKTLTTTKNVDGWGRVISEVNPYGAQVNTVYNALGQVTSVSNPFAAGGSPTAFTTSVYDTLGRQTLVTLPDNNTAQTSYSGATVTVTDQVNRKIKRESDGLGRLIKVTEQNVSSGTLNQETSYSYNYLDKLTEVNQGGQYRRFKYDNLGRMLFEKIPEQTETISEQPGVLPPAWTTKYSYTNFNAVATKTDARGVITSYTYDTMNRLTGVSYNTSGASGVAATGGVTMTYDTNQQSATNGLLLTTAVFNSNGVGYAYQENYSYNGNNQVSSVARTIDTKSYTTSYEYNEAGQATKLTYPSSYFYYLNHDNLGRLQALSQFPNWQNGNVGYLTNVSYNTAGQVTGLTLGNGVVESYGYDANRLQLTSQTATKGATSLMNLTYNYAASAGQNGSGSTAGNSGQLMSISGTINATTESAAYTYDNLGRLVTSNQTTNSVSAQRRFVYDRWGNRTSEYDATTGGTQIQSIALQQSGGAPTNRLTSVTNGSTTLNYSYDAAGNVTNDGLHSYTYDAENRVVNVDAGATASYGYDHQNRRIKKVIGSTTTHCVWQGGKVLAEHNGSTGAVITNYTYSGSRMIAKTSSGTTSYFLNDRLSARVTLDASGNVIGRQATLPFGEELGGSGTTDKHKLANYERDPETGNDYAVNRGYAPTTGRFNQADPYRASGGAADPQSWNRYAYARNDAINLVDPAGLSWFPIITWRPTFSPTGVVQVYAGPSVIDVEAAAASGGVTELWKTQPRITEGGPRIGERGGDAEDVYQKSLEQGIDKTREFIAGLDPNSECAKFLGPNAVAAFDELVKILKVAPVQGGSPSPTGIRQDHGTGTNVLVGNSPTGGYRIPGTALVYREGPFFMQSGSRSIGGYTAGSMGARVLSLLHELAHNILVPDGVGGFEPLIPNDGDDASKSGDNTSKILEKCGKEIFKANK